MNGRMKIEEWMNGRMEERNIGRMEEWKNRRMDELKTNLMICRGRFALKTLQLQKLLIV